MAKDKKGYPQNWGGTNLNWTPLAQKQVEAVGKYIEGLKTLNDMMLPGMNERNKNGEWNVSFILETALLRVARDVQQITPEQWQRYADMYFETRIVGDEKYWHVSEASGNALDKIVERLESIGFEKLHHAGKINKKLVLSMALSYVMDWLAARGY